MTEEEAKKKWCPFARVATSENEPSYNRYGNITAFGSTCLASECMAWRWNDHKTEDVRSHHGYCGLAGKP